VEEVCTACGFDRSTAPPREVAAALSPLARAIGDSIRAISGDETRRRPTPAVWSPLEYLGHLRESMAFHRWLIEQALAEKNPRIPKVDPDESVAQARHNDADVDQLVAQFERRIQRLADVLTELDDEGADRPLARG
jgi:hypothetical protein